MSVRYEGLTLRDNTYYVRKRVPDDVRGILGKRELWGSLGTGDIVEARRAHGPLFKKFEDQIAAARRGEIFAPPSPHEVAAAVKAIEFWSATTGRHLPPDPSTELSPPWNVIQTLLDQRRLDRIKLPAAHGFVVGIASSNGLDDSDL